MCTKSTIYALFNLVQCGNKRKRWVDFAPQLPQHCFCVLWFPPNPAKCAEENSELTGNEAGFWSRERKSAKTPPIPRKWLKIIIPEEEIGCLFCNSSKIFTPQDKRFSAGFPLHFHRKFILRLSQLLFYKDARAHTFQIISAWTRPLCLTALSCLYLFCAAFVASEPRAVGV